MNFNHAARIYRETNASTLPKIEYVILLLKALSRNIDACLEGAGALEKKEMLRQGQELLFELLATPNRKTEEGERLFTLYVYLNQLIVTAQLTRSGASLEEAGRITGELITSWEAAQQKTRRQTYTSDQI